MKCSERHLSTHTHSHIHTQKMARDFLIDFSLEPVLLSDLTPSFVLEFFVNRNHNKAEGWN